MQEARTLALSTTLPNCASSDLENFDRSVIGHVMSSPRAWRGLEKGVCGAFSLIGHSNYNSNLPASRFHISLPLSYRTLHTCRATDQDQDPRAQRRRWPTPCASTGKSPLSRVRASLYSFPAPSPPLWKSFITSLQCMHSHSSFNLLLVPTQARAGAWAVRTPCCWRPGVPRWW